MVSCLIGGFRLNVALMLILGVKEGRERRPSFGGSDFFVEVSYQPRQRSVFAEQTLDLGHHVDFTIAIAVKQTLGLIDQTSGHVAPGK